MAGYQPHSLRDRTVEFLSISERLQKQQGTATPSGVQEGSTGHTRAPNSSAVEDKSEFARRASAIGLGIHKTSVKLQKLAGLARRTSMFDDPANEIAELSGLIKQDIRRLNTEIAELQAASAARSAGAANNVQTEKHSNTVVDNLRLRLKDTAKEFQDVLTLRTDNLKGQDNRRQLFSSTSPQNGYSSTTPLLLSRSGAKGQGKSAHQLFGGAGQGSEGASSSGEYTEHSQQQQQQLVPAQDTYLDSRAAALHTAEATIVELGGIFQQLADMASIICCFARQY